MTICAACEALRGKRKAEPPHAALKVVEVASQSRRTMGNVKGEAITYRCSDCRTTWVLDTDPRDDFAGWEIVKPGK